ncbi:MAG: hypothetical protein CSB02_01120 [Bacteroidia bacterium]|nr:MAG: hypothetical protein CSB02_01120 [Bacteroidia bacterium]
MLSLIIGNTSLTTEERHALRLHLFYAILDGLVLGVLALNEFVFLKSMHGSDLQISILFQFSVLVFIGLVFINEWLRRIANKKRLLQITALVTRLPLLLLLIFPTQGTYTNVYHLIFLAVFFIYYLASPIIYPTINQMFKNIYSHHNFGLLFARIGAVNKVVMLVGTFLYAWGLDIWPHLFVYVLPGMAPVAIVSIFLLSSIPYQHSFVTPKAPFLSSIKTGLQRMHRLLFHNKAYLHFEIGFMLYGFAFMSTVAVITIYFDAVLQLNYSSVAFYKNAYNILAIIMMPYFGKLYYPICALLFYGIRYQDILQYDIVCTVSWCVCCYYGLVVVYWLCLFW